MAAVLEKASKIASDAMGAASESSGPPASLEDVVKLLANDTKVKVAGVDIDGVLRGKIMAKSKFLACCKESPPQFGFCSVIFGWDIHDTNYVKELGISNRENGYRDIIAQIDLSSFRRIPFENNIAFFLVTFMDPDEPTRVLHACPRGNLRAILERLSSKHGLTAYAGAEFEFFQFKGSCILR